MHLLLLLELGDTAWGNVMAAQGNRTLLPADRMAAGVDSVVGDARRECPVPLDELEASTLDASRAMTLPPRCYTSPEFFEFEKAAIFRCQWLCLGRAEQIPTPGDYFTLTIADEPLIIVRDRDGEVCVLSAVCRHRGTLLAEDTGNCGRSFVCPYHSWSYDLHGQLIGAPGMEHTTGFDKRDVSLPRLQVELWNGFIFANFDDAAAPLGPRLRGLEALLADYHLADLVTTAPDIIPDAPFNWKIMMENGVEPYHAPFLHRRYVPSRGDDTLHSLEWSDDSGAIVSQIEVPLPPGVEMDVGVTPHGGCYFPVIESLTREQRRRFSFATVPPNLMLGWQADLVFWFLLVPNAPESVTLRWAYCVPETTMRLPTFEDLLQLTREGVEVFNRQDFPVNASIQRGYRSHFAARGRYSNQELVLVQINRWLVKRYREYALGARKPITAEG
jgi:phenylpropionate dioxygenase-like ring-hydroxylating dioxygenase large terminal subunit